MADNRVTKHCLSQACPVRRTKVLVDPKVTVCLVCGNDLHNVRDFSEWDGLTDLWDRLFPHA